MTPDEIKAQVSIEQVLSYYGRTPLAGKKMPCLFPEKHNHHDTHPSMEEYQDHVFCRSQGCFGDKGADIFAKGGRPHVLSQTQLKNWGKVCNSNASAGQACTKKSAVLQMAAFTKTGTVPSISTSRRILKTEEGINVQRSIPVEAAHLHSMNRYLLYSNFKAS